jgi:hypothetical protein
MVDHRLAKADAIAEIGDGPNLRMRRVSREQRDAGVRDGSDILGVLVLRLPFASSM